MPVVVEAPDEQTARIARRLIGRRTGVSVVISQNGNGSNGSHFAEPGRRVRIADTGPLTPAEALRLLQSGIWAVIPDQHSEVESRLRDCVDMVRSGTSPLLSSLAGDSGAVDDFLAALRSGAAGRNRRSAKPSPLSDRETEILQMISEGMTSAAIANDMGFQLQTIKNKVTTILTKTQANSRTHAVAIALANGWIKGT